MTSILGIVASSKLVASGSFESIATGTGTGSNTTITFSSIPSTYKHLQIRGLYRDTDTGAYEQRSMALTFNGDTVSSNYNWHYLQGDGSSATAFGSNNRFIGSGTSSASGNTLNYGANIFDIIDYASTTKNKTTRAFSGENINTATAADQQVFLTSHLWKSTSAITSITLTSIYGNFATGCVFSLYGIRG